MYTFEIRKKFTGANATLKSTFFFRRKPTSNQVYSSMYKKHILRTVHSHIDETKAVVISIINYHNIKGEVNLSGYLDIS